MKRLITTAMILSLLGGAVAQAGSAGAVVGQRQDRPDRGGGEDRGPRPDRGPRVDRGERGDGGGRQQQPQAQPPRADRPDRDGRGDRGGRPNWGGGAHPAPEASQPPSAPRAESPRPDRGDWQGRRGGERDRHDNDGPRSDRDRPDRVRPDRDRPDRGQDHRDRGDRGDRGGWDRGSGRGDQGWRPDQRRPDDGRPDYRRPGQGGQWRDRDRDRPRYDQRRYRPSYHAPRRYRAPAYRYPRGFYVHRWSFGDRLPGGWYSQPYYLDWFRYGLPMPPVGCEWIRVGDDAVLVDVWSGQVLSVYYDLFW